MTRRSWWRAVVAELVAVVVDDVAYATTIVVFVCLAGGLVAWSSPTDAWPAISFAFGLAAILVSSAWWQARKKRRGD